MKERINYYHNQIDNLQQKLTILLRRNRYLSFFRLIAAVGAVVSFYALLSWSLTLATATFVVLMGIFSIMVYSFSKNDKRIKKYKLLKSIQENEISCLNTRKNTLFSHGDEYMSPHHAYSSDLDIFGPHSLFQYLNRCVTKMGRNTLAQWLSAPGKDREILEKQNAARELSEKTNWRQDIMRYGLSKNLENDDPEFVVNWANTPSQFSKRNTLYYAISILPFLTAPAFVYTLFGSDLPFSFLIMIHFLIHYRNFRAVNAAHDHTSKRSDMLKIYSFILRKLEREDWQSDRLKQLSNDLKTKDETASHKIMKLTKLVSLLDQRLNMVVQLLLNMLFFYELHLLFRIEKWKQKYGHETEKWFQTIGEVEALSTLGNLTFNHEDWSFAEVSNSHFSFEAINMGHPLIDPAKRVCNDYNLNGKGVVHIITGSNMAGKSTFLRTIGVNVVLALAGAPVCAKKLKVSNVEVNTSMRIKDSIEENESSFYAELRRIQQVIRKVNKKENTLLLLDEILRGTNSKDKHTGSKALIKQLVKHDAVALVATHDLELSNLEKELPGKVENRFFDIKIDGDQLFFDYKLNHGVCKTFNAPILMKKMGIDMDILAETNKL